MQPEYRLPIMIPGAPIVAIGLFIYGWTSQNQVHWIAPEIGIALVGLGLLVSFVSFCWLLAPCYTQLIHNLQIPTLNYLVDAYTRCLGGCSKYSIPIRFGRSPSSYWAEDVRGSGSRMVSSPRLFTTG